MSDLICRKTMTRCQTPGMCAPHGGCSTSAEAARAALVERAVAPAPASGVPGTIGVKRYIPDGYTQPASRSGTGTHMVESRDGDYVLASDYDALAQRCQELEAGIDQLRAEVEALRKDKERLAWMLDEECEARELSEIHPDDMAVDRFAEAMKEKLAESRAKGRGGWNDSNQCRVEYLADLLVHHTKKGNAGNYVDIANISMMLHLRQADPRVLADRARRAQGERK